MVGHKWSKICFLVMIHIETVLGNNKNKSVTEGALGSRTISCSIKGINDNNIQHDGTDKFTNYDVFMSSTWRKRKGCYSIITVIPDRKQTQLEYNSPGSCSLFCDSHDYFGLQDKMCVCLEKIDWLSPVEYDNCDEPCHDNNSKPTCGSRAGTWYFDVYHHRIELNQDPVDQDDVDKKCVIASHLAETNIKYKAVACPRQSTEICFLEVGGSQTLEEKLRSTIELDNCTSCYVYRDEQNRKTTDQLSNSKFCWTTFRRSKILVSKIEDRKYKIFYNSACQLEMSHNWNTTRLSLKSTKKTYPHITLRCDIKTSSEWTELCVKDMDNNENDAHYFNTHLSTAAEYTSSSNEKAIFTTNTKEFESYGSSTSVELTSAYHSNTTDTSFYSENYVFFLHIGIAISGSCFVILIATVACCLYRPKRSEENIVMATEGPPQDTMPTAALAENYSEPKDKASSSSEMIGPRFCATTHCQSTNCQKTENGEYHHLDFTLRSETAPRFADNNEYAHVRANVISVFEQPWDAATSKVNKLFSQISKSVALKGQNIRNSIIKRRESRSGSPKLKCRASDYCDAWKTQLNKQQFVFDSDVDNQSDISIDIANSTVDSNKNKPKLRSTDSAFPVLPYSERINVKSTHIYDEPDERRMSLRERLLHMISIRPLKMPFGIELDLRASRSKSKIYSVATSLDEIDESVA